MSVAPWTLRDGDRDLPRLAAAQNIDRHALPDRVAFQGALNIVRVLNGLAAELDHDVADQYAGLGGGSRGFQRQYDQTFVMIGKLDWLQADAQIAARHVSARQDFVHHAIHGHGGDGQPGDARERAGGDPDGLAGGIDDGAAIRPGVEGEIEADVVVEAPAAPGAPLAAARADDAEGGVRPGILGAPDGEGESAGYGRAGGDARSLVGGLDFEDGDVGAGVGAGEAWPGRSCRRAG